MGRWLPWIYATAIVLEAAGLQWLFAKDPPEPSEPSSIWLGWIGLGSMVALLVYSVARRSRSLRRWAKLSHWLHFHIFLACQAVVCVYFHCYHVLRRETPFAVLNPGLLSLAAVGVVFCSGLVGRFLYALVPRKVGGVQMSAQEVEQELEAFDASLLERLQPALSGAGTGFAFAVPFRARAARRQVRGLGLPLEQQALAERRLALEHKRHVLKTTQRIFGYWIVLHRPLAVIMYVLALLHVVLSFMFAPALGG